MQITVEETHTPGEAQLVLRCETLTPALRELAERAAALLSEAEGPPRIAGRARGVTVLLEPAAVYYLESVDNMVFAYTRDAVYQTALTLAAAGEKFAPWGFLRTSKTQVLNLHRLERLKTQLDGGIDGTLENGEHLIISRRYARGLREALKGGRTL